jgi:hypothetical protein
MRGRNFVPRDDGGGPGRFRARDAVARCTLGMVTFAVLGLVGTAAAAAEEPLDRRIPGLSRPAEPKSDDEASIYADAEGRARTSMFGVSGIGHKFVYVLDRSSSMGGSGQKALRAVKAELVKSLRNLDTVHEFQIIFYNEKPVIFNPSGTPGRLAFANRANKDRAVRFVESITADGNNNHVDALKLAIRLHPDVIFFLTDGDEPKLSRRELDQIQRMATGITFNTIEFGPGPKPEEESFLATLAEENGGHYVYVDLSKYFSAESQKSSR